MVKQVVALMGSYRKGGALDSTVREVLSGARAHGAETRQIDLVDADVRFCRNCRTCTGEPGEERGRCVIDDDASGIFDALDHADAIVLGAPVNFGDVNAMTRQLLERTVAYSYWPPGAPAPKLRDGRQRKKAVLVTSSAAPAWMTRLFARPLKTLRQMAKLLHARPVATVVAGLAGEPLPELSARVRRAARRAGEELVA